MIYEDVSYGKETEQKADIRVKEGAQKTVVYIHGGGLDSGDKRDAAAFLSALQEAGYSVISVNYRLYPQAVFPEYIKDCAAALRFVSENAGKFGYAKNFAVIGSSAGAYILLMLLFDEKYLSEYGVSRDDFAAFLVDSAQPTTHFRVLEERGIERNAIRIDDASPLFFLKKCKTFPKLTIVTYEDDMFCRKEQNMMFSKALESYGIRHNFCILKGGHCAGEYPDENNEIPLLALLKRDF